MPLLGWFIIIVVILMLVYGFWFQDNKPQEDFAIGRLQESNGTFDEPAADALTVINKKAKPSAKERVARADIIRYNMLDDTINDEAIARALADDYAAGAILADNADDAEVAAGRLRTLTARPTQAAAILLEDTARLAASTASQINAERKAAAKATHRTRGEIARSYMRASSVIADDRQNVHDSAANADMRETLRKIGAGNIGPIRAIAEARSFIMDPAWQGANPDINVDAALAALDMIGAARHIGTFSTTEDRIFASVWSRACHPDNMLAETDLKTSIAHALADMREGAGFVCINGRCARMIGALAAIDRDPSIGSIGTYDTYKAKIIAESGKIMDETLERMRKKDPASVAKWEAGEDSEVNVELTNAISEHVNTYRGRIPDVQLDAIRETCVTAVL